MPMPINVTPQFHERVVCSVASAIKYQVPANIVLAVAEKEGGRPGLWVRNRNGTHDVGALQFNTRYLVGLARYGIQPADVAASGCFAYDLAAWRLRQHLLNDRGDLWTRAANYHSRTQSFNAIYRADLKQRAARWADWLATRYEVRNLMMPEVSGVPPPIVKRSAYYGLSGPGSLRPGPSNIDYVPRGLLEKATGDTK